jgi:RNA recognition motif-containing protein
VATEEAATETAAAQKPRSFAKPVEDQTCIAYVVNLSYDTPGYKLREIFGEFGTVQKVFIPKRKDTGKAKGIAFITMSSKEERDLAITKLTGTQVDGRTVYVDEAKPRASEGEKKEVASKKLYVGNICFTTTKEDLVEFFGEFGFVQDVYIPLDRESQQPRGFAFVKMGPSDADAAIEATNGVDLQGRRIDVKESLPRGIKAPPRAQVTRSEVKLYVGNLSFDTEEERVRDVFEEFGPLIDVYLPVDRYSGNSRGFAFVTVTSEMAQSAIEATDGLELDGRMLRVNEAQPKGFRNTNYDEEEESWGNEGEGDGEGEYEE